MWCNGGTFSSSTYPELYSVLGSTTLPNLNGRFIEGTNTANDIGKTVSAGLPNITGYFGSGEQHLMISGSGAFARVDGAKKWAGSNTTYWETDRYNINFDASRSNSIYGNSSTVQPNSYVVMYIIKAK